MDVMRSFPDATFDLCFCSPPYEDSRTYGIAFNLKEQEWVDWAVIRFRECLRITKGLVCWVVEGKTRKFRWSATPALLMADLHRHGVKLRKPPIYSRVGIPGSGGPDWLRNDYEFIICATHGKLPWSNNTAMGGLPKYKPGGDPSHRTKSGDRVNRRRQPGEQDIQTRRKSNGKRLRDGAYKEPQTVNPGNIIRCHGGGGHMGSKLAHQNEAPFPEKLATFFIRSFCPPGGSVVDPFCGSGTTLAVANANGRTGVGIDIRENQIELSARRLNELK